jgi:hypothetical protein
VARQHAQEEVVDAGPLDEARMTLGQPLFATTQ